jgi:DNA invertase Pin-like site-specific DNA recombinase
VRQGQGSSIERQLKLTREYCDRHNLILNESMTDEGLSAYAGDHTARGSLGRFMQAVEEGRIERDTYLIVESLDRLSRQAVRPALTQFLRLIDAGIKIVTLFDGRVYEDTSESVEIDLIVAILNMSEAHKSSLSKSIRLKQAWDIKRAGDAKLTRMCPAWLTYQDDKFVPNAGADIVRRIYSEAANGLGSYHIAAGLNRDLIPPLTGDKRHGEKLPDGGPNPKVGQLLANGWNKGRIVAILKSDAPLGLFQPHKKVGKNRVPVGEPLRDYYPAIVEHATAAKARANVASRTFGGSGSGRKGEVISNLFTGVARCVCGNPMFLTNKLASRGQAGWLRCSDAAKQRHCVNRLGIRYDRFEGAVLRDFHVIMQLIMATPRDDNSREIEEALASKRAEADRLKRRIAEMSNEFGEGSFAIIAAQMRAMAERHQAILSEIEELDRQLKIARHSTVDVKALEKRYISERLNAADPAVVRKARAELAIMIRRIFAKQPIKCDYDKVVIMQTFDFGDADFTLRMCYEDDFELKFVVDRIYRYLDDRTPEFLYLNWHEANVRDFIDNKIITEDGFDHAALAYWVEFLKTRAILESEDAPQLS